MKNHDIKEAFGRIEASDQVKEHVYWEAWRDASDKEVRSKKRLHYFKMRLDRLAPVAALFVLLIFGFSYFAVSTGLFTGVKPVPEAATYSGETGMAQIAGEGEPAAPEAAPQEEMTEGAVPELAAKDNAAPTRDITAYGAIDVGFTAFKIAAVPEDPAALWQELQRVGAVPAGIELTDASLEESRLTLDFSAQLQAIMDASATDSAITGIALSYKSLFPYISELQILSEGAPLRFGGKEIDASALMEGAVSVTDTKTFDYQGDLP